jgi:hypothetical protein
MRNLPEGRETYVISSGDPTTGMVVAQFGSS